MRRKRGFSKMPSKPYMPLYCGDYLGDTSHLNQGQHGAYVLLMMHYWRKGPLTIDKKQLYLITRARTIRERRNVDAVLNLFFDGKNGSYRNNRLDLELRSFEKKAETLAEAGRQGAGARWGGYSDRNATAMRKGWQPEPEPDTKQAKTYTLPFVIWQNCCGNLPQAMKFTEKRRFKCKALLRKHKGNLTKFQEDFRKAVERASQTPFLCGEGSQGWVASFDWFINNDTNYIAVLEGKYDSGKREKGRGTELPPAAKKKPCRKKDCESDAPPGFIFCKDHIISEGNK